MNFKTTFTGKCLRPLYRDCCIHDLDQRNYIEDGRHAGLRSCVWGDKPRRSFFPVIFVINVAWLREYCMIWKEDSLGSLDLASFSWHLLFVNDYSNVILDPAEVKQAEFRKLAGCSIAWPWSASPIYDTCVFPPLPITSTRSTDIAAEVVIVSLVIKLKFH